MKAWSALESEWGRTHPVSAFSHRRALLRERADLGTVLVTTAMEPEPVSGVLEAVVGFPLPARAGPMHSHDTMRAVWRSPRAWLIQCPVAAEEPLVASVNTPFPEREVIACAYGDALCWLDLAGPGAEDLLREGGFISLDSGGLPVGHGKRGLLAGVAVTILHEASEHWQLGVERNVAGYFVHWLATVAGRTY